MASINQNGVINPLPDFRNLGVMLRILVIVTAATLLAEALSNASFGGWLQASAAMIAFVLHLEVCARDKG